MNMKKKKDKNKTIEQIKANMYVMICEVLEDWSETQFNIGSICARESLADAIIENIFEGKDNSKI